MRRITKRITKRIITGLLTAALAAGVVGCAEPSASEKDTVVTEADSEVAENGAEALATDTINEDEALPEEGQEEPQQEQAPVEVTFTDALGREVTVSDPMRVAVLLGSFCDVWYLAGGEAVATVKDAWTSFDLDLPENTVNVGSFLEPDLEQLIASEPDFVIASAGNDAQKEMLDTLESTGITTAYFDVQSFDDYLAMLDICTQITGKRENYEKYGTDVAAQIEEAKKRVGDSHPTVLFIRAAASSVKAKGSEGTVGGEILADIGCINIADSDGSLLENLSMEAIIAADPEYIFVTTQGDDTEAALANVEELLKSNPAWASLSAVQSGNYYEIDKSLYNSKPNARWGEAYEQLIDIIYPEG